MANTNANLKTVEPLAEGTKGASRAEVMAKAAALKAQLAALFKEMPEIDAQEKAEIDELRYQAFKINRQREPLDSEYERISKEYTAKVGSPGFNEDGSAKLAKIVTRESDEKDSEYQKFLSRWHAENKRNSK